MTSPSVPALLPAYAACSRGCFLKALNKTTIISNGEPLTAAHWSNFSIVYQVVLLGLDRSRFSRRICRAYGKKQRTRIPLTARRVRQDVSSKRKKSKRERVLKLTFYIQVGYCHAGSLTSHLRMIRLVKMLCKFEQNE